VVFIHFTSSSSLQRNFLPHKAIVTWCYYEMELCIIKKTSLFSSQNSQNLDHNWQGDRRKRTDFYVKMVRFLL
jgi:hypothetical protein